MAVQNRVDNSTVPFIKSGYSYVRNGVIKQDAARAADLLQNTVMAYDTANEQWVPFVSLVDVTGESVPQGIYIGGDIAHADLVAGNIMDCPILIGGCCTIDGALTIFDLGTLDVDSIIPASAAGPIFVVSAGACLRMFGIYLEDTVPISGYEN